VGSLVAKFQFGWFATWGGGGKKVRETPAFLDATSQRKSRAADHTHVLTATCRHNVRPPNAMKSKAFNPSIFVKFIVFSNDVSGDDPGLMYYSSKRDHLRCQISTYLDASIRPRHQEVAARR